MYKSILVPLDGSKLAECVFGHLETVVGGCGLPPAVTLVRAVEPISVPVGWEVSVFASLEQVKQFEGHQKTEAEAYLKETAINLKQKGIEVKTEVINGKPGDVISDFANKQGIDLIIIATHGRSGVGRLVWGSVAEHVLRTSHSAVLMVRANPDPARS